MRIERRRAARIRIPHSRVWIGRPCYLWVDLIDLSREGARVAVSTLNVGDRLDFYEPHGHRLRSGRAAVVVHTNCTDVGVVFDWDAQTAPPHERRSAPRLSGARLSLAVLWPRRIHAALLDIATCGAAITVNEPLACGDEIVLELLHGQVVVARRRATVVRACGRFAALQFEPLPSLVRCS